MSAHKSQIKCPCNNSSIKHLFVSKGDLITLQMATKNKSKKKKTALDLIIYQEEVINSLGWRVLNKVFECILLASAFGLQRDATLNFNTSVFKETAALIAHLNFFKPSQQNPRCFNAILANSAFTINSNLQCLHNSSS